MRSLPEGKSRTMEGHFSKGNNISNFRRSQDSMRGQAWWLMPVISALLEAEAVGSPEVRSSRPDLS